jgi:hypothetical protein
MMNALRQATLEDLSLQPPLQEILNLQSQHVIESHTGLIEDTGTDETTDEGVTLEETFGVFGIELEQLTSSTTDFGEDEGNAPDFALVAETVFSGELKAWNLLARAREMGKDKEYLQLRIETGGFERSTRDLITVGQRLYQHKLLPSTTTVDLEDSVKKTHVLLWFLGALHMHHQPVPPSPHNTKSSPRHFECQPKSWSDENGK